MIESSSGPADDDDTVDSHPHSRAQRQFETKWVERKGERASFATSLGGSDPPVTVACAADMPSTTRPPGGSIGHAFVKLTT